MFGRVRKGWWCAIALAALSGCVAADTRPSLVDPTTFITYAHPSGVFTLNLPPDWVVNDLSNDAAINVEFSPPNASASQVGIFIVSLSALTGPAPAAESPDGATPVPSLPDLNALATVYEKNLYATGGVSFQEAARESQPDGSLRLNFVLQSGGRTSQHNDFAQIIGPYFVALRTRLPDDAGQFRTVSRIINTMTINPLSSWASVVETAETKTRDAVGFTGLNAWVRQAGGFEIAGQVTNNALTGLEFVRIQTQLYDAEDRLLAQRDDFVSSDEVTPGQYAPFSIVFSDGLPPGVVRYELHASARYADVTAKTFYSLENFEVATQSEIDRNGFLALSGQVTNTGSLTASLVKVIVTIFDEQQRVIATDTTLVDQPLLGPGQSANYQVTFAELGGAPSTFSVSAQGVIGQ